MLLFPPLVGGWGKLWLRSHFQLLPRKADVYNMKKFSGCESRVVFAEHICRKNKSVKGEIWGYILEPVGKSFFFFFEAWAVYLKDFAFRNQQLKMSLLTYLLVRILLSGVSLTLQCLKVNPRIMKFRTEFFSYLHVFYSCFHCMKCRHITFESFPHFP